VLVPLSSLYCLLLSEKLDLGIFFFVLVLFGDKPLSYSRRGLITDPVCCF
jgi:hypothetical protein